MTDPTLTPSPVPTPVIVSDPIPATVPPKLRGPIVPLIVSLVMNGVFLIILLITADKLRTNWEDGFYKGQIKVYSWMESWGYGELTYRIYNSEFTFKDKKLMVYVYNRNYFPDTTQYPENQPPVDKFKPLSTKSPTTNP